MRKKTTDEGLTRRDVAKRLHLSRSSVERLIAEGRLHPSGTRGKAQTFDLAAVQALGRTLRQEGRAAGGTDRSAYLLARTRFQTARAEALERENRRRAGELVESAEVEAQLVADFHAFRSRVLGLPAKLRQQVPTLTAADARVVDRLCRALLEELGSMRQAAGAAERGR